MAINYPTSLDSFSTKTDNVDDVQAVDINDVQSAIEELEEKVGIDSSADTSSLDYKINNLANANIASAAAIDATKIANGTVSSTEFQYINSLSSNAQTQLNTKLESDDDSIIKAWGRVTGSTGALVDGFNVSTSRVSSGIYTLTFGTNFANTNYAVILSLDGVVGFAFTSNFAAGSVRVETFSSSPTVTDRNFSFIAIGDQ